MALTIYENKSGAQEVVIADRKIWLDRDGQAVEDGDPKAKILFCCPGQRISKKQAEAHGLTFEAKAEEPAPDTTTKDDPLSGTVDEVKAHVAGVDSIDELDELEQAESSGKARKGVLGAIDKRREELEELEDEEG